MTIKLSIAKKQRGATMIEYAIMAGLIAAIVVVAVALLGQQTNGLFSDAVAKYPK